MKGLLICWVCASLVLWLTLLQNLVGRARPRTKGLPKPTRLRTNADAERTSEFHPSHLGKTPIAQKPARV